MFNNLFVNSVAFKKDVILTNYNKNLHYPIRSCILAFIYKARSISTLSNCKLSAWP